MPEGNPRGPRGPAVIRPRLLAILKMLTCISLYANEVRKISDSIKDIAENKELTHSSKALLAARNDLIGQLADAERKFQDCLNKNRAVGDQFRDACADELLTLAKTGASKVTRINIDGLSTIVAAAGSGKKKADD